MKTSTKQINYELMTGWINYFIKNKMKKKKTFDKFVELLMSLVSSIVAHEIYFRL